MAIDAGSLDEPFRTLQAFDWGGDTAALAVIDAATVAAHDDTALRERLEKRLVEVLKSDASRAAKDYACRKLCMIGTAASVSTLEAMLPNPDLSHMARFVLERLEAIEAAAALRKALDVVRGSLKIGMISSLASRGDVGSVPAIAALLAKGGSADGTAVAAAAAEALGTLATSAAAEALAKPRVSGIVAEAVIDARLACANAMAVSGRKKEARAIYQSVGDALGDAPTTHRGRAVRIACQRGMFATMAE